MIDLAKLAEKHFPFEKFNPGQKQAIIDVVASIQAGNKHVILEAPTGVGKSVIATTVHNMLQEIDENWRTTITTTTKALQDQYCNDDKSIFDLRGRKNYGCNEGAEYYNSGECRVLTHKHMCQKETNCDYYITRQHWCEEAALRLTNVAFQIEACPMLVCAPENKANLIVLDECHNLPAEIVSHSCLEINLAQIPNTKDVAPQLIPALYKFVDSFKKDSVGGAAKITKKQLQAARDIAMDATAIFENLQGAKTNTQQMKKNMSAVEELQNFTDKLFAFSRGTGKWILTAYIIGNKLQLKPVYANQVAEGSMFSKADVFLHMSAAICGIEQYTKQLGITDCVYVSVENPIPARNRKIIMKAVAPMSQKHDNTKKMAAAIDKIANHQKGNGVVHSVSFKLAEQLKEQMQNKHRVLISNNRREILHFLKTKTDGILVSPSVETGYDFKEDLCRWQIIPKVPYLYIGDPYVKYNMENDSDWYAREAILRMIQASGRGVRGITDWANTFILDSNACPLIANNACMFPEWWIDALVM